MGYFLKITSLVLDKDFDYKSAIGLLLWYSVLFLDLKITKHLKAMAPHSSTLAWKIPWTEETGRLQSMGSLRVGHD